MENKCLQKTITKSQMNHYTFQKGLKMVRMISGIGTAKRTDLAPRLIAMEEEKDSVAISGTPGRIRNGALNKEC